MSTSEKWTRLFCLCPCGLGKIIEHVDSPDNPWSKTHRTYELDCTTCEKAWILEDETLYSRSDRLQIKDCWIKQGPIERKLNELGKVAIDSILSRLDLDSFKREHHLLKEAGVCREGPIRFSRARNSGTSASQMCDPLQNIQWILRELPPSELKQTIKKLQDDREDSEHVEENAKRRLQSLSLSELKRRRN